MISKYEAKLLRMLVLDEEFNANSKFKLSNDADKAARSVSEEKIGDGGNDGIAWSAPLTSSD